MQKTILVGKKPTFSQNTNPKSNVKVTSCPNCCKLQSQIVQLKQSIRDEQNQTKGPRSHIQEPKSIQKQLFQLRQKYLVLRRQLDVIEKQNDQLFEQNIWANKQLNKYRKKQQQVEHDGEPLLIDSNQQDGEIKEEEKVNQNTFMELQSLHMTIIKELEVQLFVWKEKTQNLETLMKEKTDEIARLKELLRRRNRLQEERHTLLAMVAC